MRNLFWSITLMMSIGFCGLQNLAAQCNGTFRFVNNTGRTVTDLHITFEEKGAELVTHTFPGRPSTNSASYEGPETNGTEKRWDIIKGRLPNKGVVTVEFKSKDCRLRIASWYWTVDDNGADRPYGELRAGTNAAGNSLDNDLVADGEVVTKLELVQPYTKESRGKKTRIGINDLHIVTKKRPSVLNRTRKAEGDDPRAGGIFEDEDITECNCDVVQNDSPCKQVCKGQTGMLYVLNLATTSVLSLDDKVTLELKGVEPDDIAWHWWTKDGYPYTGTWNDPTKGRKGAGVPETEGDNKDGKPKEDWGSVASIAFLPQESDSDTYFAVGLTNGIAQSPYALNTHFAQTDIDQLTSSIYEDPTLFNRLFEALGSEFFIGSFSEAPRFENTSMGKQPEYGVSAAYGFLANVAVEAQLKCFSANATAAFPLMVFNEINGENQSMLGQYEISQKGWQSSLGLNYLLGDGPLQGYAGAYAGLQQTEQSILARIADVEWNVETSTTNTFGYGLRLGGRYLTNSGFFIDARLQTADFGASMQLEGQAIIGFQF